MMPQCWPANANLAFRHSERTILLADFYEIPLNGRDDHGNIYISCNLRWPNAVESGEVIIENSLIMNCEPE